MLEVKIPTTISSERISDMIVTAFEGGSNHWLAQARLIKGETSEKPWYADPKLYEQDFEIHLWAEGPHLVVKPGQLRLGFELMAAKFPAHWADFLDENEDADTADVWLQLCVFGEVVYG